MKFYEKFYSWRTSALGAGAITTVATDVIVQFAHGLLDPSRIGGDVTGFILGVGLLFARDSAASELEHDLENTKLERH